MAAWALGSIILHLQGFLQTYIKFTATLDLAPNGGLVRESSQDNLNPGLGIIIIICPELFQPTRYFKQVKCLPGMAKPMWVANSPKGSPEDFAGEEGKIGEQLTTLSAYDFIVLGGGKSTSALDVCAFGPNGW